MARGSVIATDDFNRAGPGLGANWSSRTTGTITIESSIRFGGEASANNAASAWVGAGSFDADQYADVNVIGVTGGSSNYGAGVIARASADTGANRDFYYALTNRTGTRILGKVVNGTETELHSASGGSEGEQVGIECEGTTIRLCIAGTPLGGSFTVTDTALATGSVGILGRGDPTLTFGDNFQAGNMSAGGVVGGLASGKLGNSILLGRLT